MGPYRVYPGSQKKHEKLEAKRNMVCDMCQAKKRPKKTKHVNMAWDFCELSGLSCFVRYGDVAMDFFVAPISFCCFDECRRPSIHLIRQRLHNSGAPQILHTRQARRSVQIQCS